MRESHSVETDILRNVTVDQTLCITHHQEKDVTGIAF